MEKDFDNTLQGIIDMLYKMIADNIDQDEFDVVITVDDDCDIVKESVNSDIA